MRRLNLKAKLKAKLSPSGMNNIALPQSSRTVVYTAGACTRDGHPGGWAWVVLGEPFDNGRVPTADRASGGVPETTHNRMVLMAVLEAINSLDDELLIITARSNITDCIEQKRWISWESSNWFTEDNQPIDNQDLWQPIIKAYREGKIEFDWAVWNLDNPGCDRAAESARQEALDAVTASRKVVYTTGSGTSNPGPGGWAWVALAEQSDNGSVPFEKFASGGVPDTTDNRMDLLAVLAAINSWDDELLIITDSRYVIRCFEQGWWVSWDKNNWQTQNRKPVEHRDLWYPIIRAYQEGEVEFDWVRKDSGDLGNEAAVALAHQAAEAISAGDCSRLVRGELVQ